MNMISCFPATVLARAPDSSGFCRFQAFPGLTLERRNGIKKTPEQNPVYSTLSICAHHGTSEHAGLCVTSMMRLLLPFDKTSTCFKIICFLNAHNMSQASHPPLFLSPCDTNSHQPQQLPIFVFCPEAFERPTRGAEFLEPSKGSEASDSPAPPSLPEAFDKPSKSMKPFHSPSSPSSPDLFERSLDFLLPPGFPAAFGKQNRNRGTWNSYPPSFPEAVKTKNQTELENSLTLYLPQVSSHLPPHTSDLTPHASHLKPQTSHLTPLTTVLTPLTSHLTPQTSDITPHASNI